MTHMVLAVRRAAAETVAASMAEARMAASVVVSWVEAALAALASGASTSRRNQRNRGQCCTKL